jgi:TolB protein
METKNNLCSIIFVFLFLIFFTFAISAASAQQVDSKFTLNETRITINESDQIDPAIYGDSMVWQDERNGNWDIYLYNLSTSTETRVTTDESNQTKPAVYGDRIIWQDERNGNWDIYMFDLSIQKETQLTDGPSDQVNPAIYGDRVVWQDKRNGNWDIYMYDLSTRKEIQITTDISDQREPVIYGDRIVWQDEREGREIYLYELSNSRRLFNLFWNNQNLDLFSMFIGSDDSKVRKIIESFTFREISIATYESDKYEPPTIYGNKVVWADRSNANLNNSNLDISGIYMYDITTSKETRITTGFTSEGSCLFPVISGNTIVWQDGRSGDSDIYMYDLSTSTETQITFNESNQTKPVIYGDRIVWQDERNGNGDIYVCTLAQADAKPLSPVSNAYKSGLNLISQLLSLE